MKLRPRSIRVSIREQLAKLIPPPPLLAAACGIHCFKFGDAGLRVVNIANPANPVLAGGYTTNGSAYGIALSGNYAYVADGFALRIFDMSTLTNLVPVGRYTNTTGFARRVAVAGNYAYVADGVEGLLLLDISDPANPAGVGAIDIGYADDVAVSGDYAYVADHNYDLHVLGISDPTQSGVREQLRYARQCLWGGIGG